MIDEYKTQIRSFIMQYIQNSDLKDDDDIFSSGYINSLFAMQLVLFVEKTFKIEIGNDDLRIDNFQTINALAKMVARKRQV